MDRAKALRRLGHQVEHLDPLDLMPQSPWVYRITWKLGGDLLSPWMVRGLPTALKLPRYDLCFVDSGEWVPPSVMQVLRRYTPKIVNYCIDDPMGKRDSARFRAYRRSLPLYDLCAVVRADNVPELKRLGGKNVMRVYRSADEVNHAPRHVSADVRQMWETEVLFLGTWFPERGPFLSALINAGVPLSIRGPNWNKAPEWPLLKAYWKGGAVAGDDYALALQCAKVSLGLLSKGNRDLHTTRSMEIPALGGLLCAERTSEHTALYKEGEEALFWNGPEECAAVCLAALQDDVRRRRVAAAGHARALANGNYNEKVLQHILDTALAST